MRVPGILPFLLAAGSCALLSPPAFAMPPGMEEQIADVMVWVVVLAVPVAALYLFWKVHVLPEVFAEKHHHPQKRAIQVLCLLSLAFGGLLWPLAWLWAFAKPTAYKAAYGTDKHDDFFLEPDGAHGGKPLDLAIVDDEIVLLREKLERLSQKRALILDARTRDAAAASAKEDDHA
nr:DUF3302 domain-containing protein [Chromobacterium sp. ASV5]